MGLKKAQDIQSKYTDNIEKQVVKLLSDCKHTSTLSDKQMTQEFEKVWKQATENVPGLKVRDIPARILNLLRNVLSNRNVHEILPSIDNQMETGKDQFKIRHNHYFNWKKFHHLWNGELQTLADGVIENCKQFVHDKTKTNGDYHESFTRELLEKIDECLQQSCIRDKIKTQFEINLKLHFCRFASRKFLKVHHKFISDNDP